MLSVMAMVLPHAAKFASSLFIIDSWKPGDTVGSGNLKKKKKKENFKK